MTTDRVLTVPNAISFVRLACIPLFLWLLFGVEDRAAAAWLLAALGASDWVDGYVARHFHQVSELGKVLDPTADRLILIVGVGGIIIDGSAPTWLSVAVVVREVIVGVALVILTLMGMKRFDVAWVGKAATFNLLIAFPLFLLAAAHNSAHTVALVFGYVFAIPGLALSYYSAVTYIPIMRRNLALGRAERSER
jgi:cardiolipin synthase